MIQDEPEEKQVNREKHLKQRSISVWAEVTRVFARFLIWQQVDGGTIH